jgi:hypothetical protein
MDFLYKAKFIGQGYSIEEGTIVRVVAERKDLGTVLLAVFDHLIGVFPSEHIEKIN